MRKFWIDIRRTANDEGVRIVVGKGTELAGFLSRSWERNRYNSWPPTHVAFAAYKSKVDYRFCLDESTDGKTDGTPSTPPLLGGFCNKEKN